MKRVIQTFIVSSTFFYLIRGGMTFGYENEPSQRVFTGAPAHWVESRLYTRLQKQLKLKGFIASHSSQHCTATLPLFSSFAPQLGVVLGGSLQMRHTWIELKNTSQSWKSYGMAYTIKHTYLGGPSRVQSPDEFQKKGLDDVQCSPLFKRTQDSKFESRLRCMLKTVSHPKDFLVLNYHAFQNNCLAAIDWIVDCAGGKLSRVPNLGIGRTFPRNFKARFISEHPVNSLQELPKICQKLMDRCS